MGKSQGGHSKYNSNSSYQINQNSCFHAISDWTVLIIWIWLLSVEYVIVRQWAGEITLTNHITFNPHLSSKESAQLAQRLFLMLCFTHKYVTAQEMALWFTKGKCFMIYNSCWLLESYKKACIDIASTPDSAVHFQVHVRGQLVVTHSKTCSRQLHMHAGSVRL